MTKKMGKMIFSILLLLAVFSTPSFSQSIDSIMAANAPQREDAPLTMEQTAEFPSVLRLFAALVIMAGLIGFFYFFLKKIRLKNGQLTANNIEVLEEKFLGYSGKLCIVRVSGNIFLIGVSKDSISHIHTFKDTETIDILAGYDEGHMGNSLGSFKSVINSFLSKYREKKS